MEDESSRKSPETGSVMATASAVRIGPADHGRTMGLDEFMEAEVDEGFRYELARGVVEVTEVPNDPHGEIVWKLLSIIAIHQREHPGIILRAGGGSEYRLWLPSLISGRNPDVAVTLRNTPKDRRGRRPPSLVMEVVSEGSESHHRDHVTKREEYLVFGIREYWVVDPEARSVVQLVRDGDAWVEQKLQGGQKVASLVLPGLEVAVASLWDSEEGEATSEVDREGGE
jgi:Uma2 family endonuclease